MLLVRESVMFGLEYAIMEITTEAGGRLPQWRPKMKANTVRMLVFNLFLPVKVSNNILFIYTKFCERMGMLVGFAGQVRKQPEFFC